MLGKVIEPYSKRILILIMNTFGDHREQISKESLETTKLIIQNLSGYGIK